MVPVPQDILDSDATTMDTMKEFFWQRSISYGERPSKQALRSRLVAFNSDTQTL